MITQADIEFMKTTWMAFGGWTKEQQEWAKKNWNHFTLRNGYYNVVYFRDDTCYRLRAGYQLPAEEKWFFRNDTQTLFSVTDTVLECGSDIIEVPANLLEYVRECLKRKDIGEFELRTTNIGCTYISTVSFDELEESKFDQPAIRFCRRKSASKFVEYPIQCCNGIYKITGYEHAQSGLRLAHAIDRKGFAGVKFKNQKTDYWYMVEKMVIDDRGVCHHWYLPTENCTPAIPILCRFYVEAGQLTKYQHN
jgi:hypothetical protein